jgi:hypothetical protein
VRASGRCNCATQRRSPARTTLAQLPQFEGLGRFFRGVDQGEVREIAERRSRRSRVVPTNLLAIVDGDAHKGGACIFGTRRYGRTARRTPTGVWCGRYGTVAESCRRPSRNWVNWMLPGERRPRCLPGRSQAVESNGVDDRPKGRRSDRRAHDRLMGWTHDDPAPSRVAGAQ